MITRQEAAEERRNDIIDAALQVFAQKGFNKATNKEITQAAGVKSTGLIYHYFADKRALFEAVLRERMPGVQVSLQQDDALSQPVPAVLRQVGQALLDTVADPTAASLLRLLLGESTRQPEVAQMFFESGTSRITDFLYTYLEQLMARGTIQTADLGATVRTFLGPFMIYIFLDSLLALPDPKRPDPSDLVETAVATFLTGMGYQEA